MLSSPGDTRAKAVSAQEAVVCFGGSLAGVERYRNLVLDELKGLGHVFRYVEFVDDPAAAGAVGLAAAATSEIPGADVQG